MKSCLTCGCEIADSDSACASCEAWAAALVEARPASGAAQTPEASTERVTGSRRQVTYIAVAVAALALTGFAMSARGGSPPGPSAVATPAARVVTPAPPSATAETAVQRWSTENQASWQDSRRRGAAFELLSENIVKTSFGPARPTLVIRCTAQQIDAFLITGPMKIDPRVDGKTVTIAIDGEPGRTEHWTDSDDRTSVFAPDPAAFTQRLRTARTLHVGYSPHNSSDVVAQFHVSGIDGLMGAAPKHCGATK